MDINTSGYQSLLPNPLMVKPNKISSENAQLATEQNPENSILSRQIVPTSESYASEFGFRVNEQGIFEKDLNKAAKLPNSYEINIKSIYEIAKEMTKKNNKLTLSNIDLPLVLNRYYNTLQTLNPEFASDDNVNLSRTEILELNQGFTTKSGEFDDEIIRIYKNTDELNRVLEQNKFLNPLKLDNKVISFDFYSTINDTTNNELIKPYINPQAQVSKTGLLMNFIHKDIKNTNTRINIFIEPVSMNFSNHNNFYSMLENKASFENYIKDENKEEMSFDLYLYMNGIDKKNTPEDKLFILFQQYKNYRRDLNIEEFANSSSIFQLYVKTSNDEFSQIREDFLRRNNEEDFSQLNENRQKLSSNFIEYRKRQAKLDEIVKSYMSILV